MSIAVLRPCSSFDSISGQTRKRTSSFSFSCAVFASANPRPAKAPRTSNMGVSLRRTETSLSPLPTIEANTTPSEPAPAETTKPTPVPYNRSLQYQKDQRVARRKLAASRTAGDGFTTINSNTRPASTESKSQTMPSRRGAAQQEKGAKPSTPPSHSNRSSRSRPPIVLSTAPPSVKRSTPPTKVILPSANSPHAVAIYATPRISSPLSPTRTELPARPVFPRSKQEPDLYKRALIGRMKTSDEGRKVLCMGPRLAISIWMATRDLERMVEDSDRRERELDIIMGDSTPEAHRAPPTVSLPTAPSLSNSWVLVKEDEQTERDWEMLDCASQ
ncbi:hypothetical protein FA15DRAFT_134277 [Coprinopsis marcescibilis]|uniref:Uncharacterized protein n=1 Tax=Coprinopsis marcescibilis TaxID=230819 RepID=A0A5C3L466_COPMA|nr:hypothetical protein FA15DRAFT_134277 [Coprinopsis marcescibilis]